MTQQALDSARALNPVDGEWKLFCRTGAVAAVLQFACLFATMILAFTVGTEPTSVREYYSLLINDRFAALLRMDLPTLILICLFSLTSFGIFAALHENHAALAGFGTAMVFVGMVLALAPHSATSMITLADRFAAAATEAERAQLLAAGQAVMATDLWHSTSGLLAGVFMQGGFVVLSFAMLKHSGFSRWTAYSGILANGLDLVHIFVAFWSPSLASILLSIGGLFYVVWFPLLARDLYRLGSAGSTKSATAVMQAGQAPAHR